MSCGAKALVKPLDAGLHT
jgi:hypothetical protein